MYRHKSYAFVNKRKIGLFKADFLLQNHIYYWEFCPAPLN